MASDMCVTFGYVEPLGSFQQILAHDAATPQPWCLRRNASLSQTRFKRPDYGQRITSIIRGPRGHINRRISHSGSKAQYMGDTRNQLCPSAIAVVVSRFLLFSLSLSLSRFFFWGLFPPRTGRNWGLWLKL